MEVKEQLLEELREWLVKYDEACEKARTLTPLRAISHELEQWPPVPSRELFDKHREALKEVETISAKIRDIEGKLSRQ
jgi:hypothetical protein